MPAIESSIPSLIRDFVSQGWRADELACSVSLDYETVAGIRTACVTLLAAHRDGKPTVLAFPSYESEGRNILEPESWTRLSSQAEYGVTPVTFIAKLDRIINGSYARHLWLTRSDRTHIP